MTITTGINLVHSPERILNTYLSAIPLTRTYQQISAFRRLVSPIHATHIVLPVAGANQISGYRINPTLAFPVAFLSHINASHFLARHVVSPYVVDVVNGVRDIVGSTTLLSRYHRPASDTCLTQLFCAISIPSASTRGKRRLNSTRNNEY